MADSDLQLPIIPLPSPVSIPAQAAVEAAAAYLLTVNVDCSKGPAAPWPVKAEFAAIHPGTGELISEAIAPHQTMAVADIKQYAGIFKANIGAAVVMFANAMAFLAALDPIERQIAAQVKIINEAEGKINALAATWGSLQSQLASVNKADDAMPGKQPAITRLTAAIAAADSQLAEQATAQSTARAAIWNPDGLLTQWLTAGAAGSPAADAVPPVMLGMTRPEGI